MVTHLPKDGHPPFPGWSNTSPRMVIHHPKDSHHQPEDGNPTSQLQLSWAGYVLLPHSAPSWILSLAENLASSILQDGATEWYYSLDGKHKLRRRRLPKFVKNTLPPYQQLCLKFCAVSPPKYEHVINFSCAVSPPFVLLPSSAQLQLQLSLAVFVSFSVLTPHSLCNMGIVEILAK